MDPDANLKEQRELVKKINTTGDITDAGYRLAELVQALDEWIMGGSPLPQEWYDAWWAVRDNR